VGHGGQVEREAVSSALRRHLSSELARRVDAYGIVVWVDAHREYEPVAEALCPPRTEFRRWQGSWYRLRRELEDLVRGTEPPRLVVYQPVETPGDKSDPLAEVRLGGTEYRRRLSTLIREALAGQLSPERVEELTQVRTFVEAEAALAAGAGAGVRLPSALGTADPLQMVLRILADDTDALLRERDLWDEAREVLRHLLGAQVEGEGDRLRDAVFQHLVLVELSASGWSAPHELARRTPELSADQRRLCLEAIREWRSSSRRRASYRECALRAEQALRLRGLLAWADGFAGLDTLPVLEELARAEAIQRIHAGRARDALELARQRLRSVWVVGEVPEAATWHPVWKAVEAVAWLFTELQCNPVPAAAGVDEVLDWYIERGWRVDRAHRTMEDALTQLPVFGDLEEPVSAARTAYEEWLRGLLERFTELTCAEPWQSDLLPQWEVHKAQLAAADGHIAYVLVDALRFELGKELADALRGAGAAEEVEVAPAVAAPPTTTLIGMASLLPGAERGLRLGLSQDGHLGVLVAGTPVRTVSDRVALLRAAHGEVVDLLLTDVLQRSESQLREQISGARLVLVRSQEIDEVLETDHTPTAWGYLNGLRDLLVRAIGRLTAAGVSRFVITGDHGFLILSRQLAPSAVIDPPGGAGEARRRYWVGKGGTTPEAAVRIPLSHFGLAGNLELVVPRGLTVFRAGGAQRFLHGGLSPQELVVPVITIRTKALAAERAKVDIRVPGRRVTTGVFSATLSLERDLFTEELRIQLVAHDREGQEVAKLIAGQGYDESSTTVRIHAGQREQIVTFRVTRSLPKRSRVILEAYDANGQLVGKVEVQVAANVEVDHE